MLGDNDRLVKLLPGLVPCLDVVQKITVALGIARDRPLGQRTREAVERQTLAMPVADLTVDDWGGLAAGDRLVKLTRFLQGRAEAAQCHGLAVPVSGFPADFEVLPVGRDRFAEPPDLGQCCAEVVQRPALAVPVAGLMENGCGVPVSRDRPSSRRAAWRARPRLVNAQACLSRSLRLLAAFTPMSAVVSQSSI